ncbi:DUF4340 domain-containing protein [Paenibacillus hemerocallicola]|uniref:DUF4340 domain-containing protein n=1 Tax=Paenibacillus hemerocallicola TaxID=1172614 RepID=A0A5C4T2Z0_9BACL|nr:DUF4340 domain-containing protein [Paenibacillus hemerocallicola]TNJ63434.1 DUF4340 domain-containing protein [Paenibacillus hemerocallicola]
MKRFIPTIVLVVVCIGAFWYASSQSFFKKEDDADKPKPIVTVKQEDVAGIQIKQGGIELQKKDGKWAVTKPAAYPTNAYSGDSWAGAFIALTQDSEIDANPSDLSKYGLTSPAQEFGVTMADGSSKTLQIGSALPIAGHSYAKLKDAPNVFRVSDEQIKTLQKDVSEFVDKSPFQMTYNEVSNVQMEWKGSSKSLSKVDPAKTSTESAWKLGDKEMKGTDVEPILDKMLLMSSEQMVKAISEIKMDAPEMKLQLKSTKDGKETTSVYVGKIEGEQIWIGLQSGPWVYSVPVATIQELFDRIKLPEA